MALQEGVATRISYKAYASGVISANAEPDTSTDPGASGGQQLRRVSSTLTLQKDTYQSQEIRTDRQIADFRHGVRRVAGDIEGELSPKTYQDFMEAAMRGTWSAAITLTEADFTSIAAANATSRLTFASGDPIALGLRVGDMVRLTEASVAANNRDFRIISFGGTSNREITVDPAPTDMSADTDITLARAGRKLIIPASSHVKRKFAIEHYHEDIDLAELFTECRIAGMTCRMPPTGMSMATFNVMGRNMQKLESGSSPYFSSPTAPTETGLLASVNGRLLVGGSLVGVVTGLDFQLGLAPSADPVVGQNIVPEIFLGRASVSGNMTAFLQDGTLLGHFIDETEISLAVWLTTGNAASSPFMSFYFPRIKLGGAAIQNQGEAGVPINIPFQALKKATATGHDATTLVIQDSESA